MYEWQDQVYANLELACAAVGDDQLRQAVILLDDACGFLAQAYLTERGKAPKQKYGGKSHSIPTFLRLMIDQAEPQLSKNRLNLLLSMHEVRNIFVHQVSKELEVTREQCLIYLRETLAFASDYGVRPPKLIPPDLPLETQPTEIYIEFGSKWDPRDRPAGHRKHVLDAIKRRGMLAGIIANADWPLVRCSLCQRLVPVDLLATPQDEFMTEEDEPVQVYCLYGCAQAHQAVLKEQEKESGFFDPGWYFLQPLLELIGGVPYESFG